MLSYYSSWRIEVAYNKENKELPKALENFAKSMLATTCLTVACGASAVAGTITEGTPPAPTFFPTSPNGYLLPLGTTVVNGFVGNASGERGYFGEAWFEFQGLTPGGSYTLTGTPYVGETGVRFDVYSDSGTPGPFIGNGEIGSEGGGFNATTFVAPLDGNLVVGVFASEGVGQSFTETLTQNGVPEPATVGAVGLGLGALAFAWRRKRAQ